MPWRQPGGKEKKSEELEVGYEKSTNTWELIVKYSGNISPLEDVERGIVIEQLSNEYAIVRIPENLIAEFVANPEIEFVEKPKNLYFHWCRESVNPVFFRCAEVPIF